VTDHDSGAPDGAAPKLTIGQRLLTALPNLQRPVPSNPSAPSPSPRADGDDINAAESAGQDDGDSTTSDVSGDGAAAGAGGRIRNSLLGPAPAQSRRRSTEDLDAMSREEVAHRIKRIDDRERFLAFTAAPLGVLVGVLLTAVTIHLNPAVGKAKHVADSTIYLEGGARVLLSGVVVAAAMTRRRSFVGFALLFLGTSMGAPLFALPFWALGGYLIWRVFRYQKALTAKGGAARRGGGGRAAATSRGGRIPASPRAAGRAGADAARARAQSPRRRGRKEPTPAGPTPSKRYTPPRPARPRPPAPSS
jgi:hypothetical protein